MKILIADDEPIARQVLRELIEEIRGITVIGEAATGVETAAMVGKLNPDVLLLDWEMPGMTGFEVARQMATHGLPVVIFVTAYQQHALEAFEAGAVDYLMKPVRKERLEAALEKARAHLLGLQAPVAKSAAAPELRKVVGRLGQDLHLLDPSEVVAFQAEGDIVYILTANGRYYANQTLKALEERLPADRFRRVHRATIINTDHIRKISPLTSKRWMLRMSNGLEVIVSKRSAGVVRDW